MEKITLKEMKKALQKQEGIIFQKEINDLKKDEVLTFQKDEWPVKTNPGVYYKSKKVTAISVRSKRGKYFIVKL